MGTPSLITWRISDSHDAVVCMMILPKIDPKPEVRPWLADPWTEERLVTDA